MMFEKQVAAALLDLAPREAEHHGVSRSNELFIEILAPRVAAAMIAVEAAAAGRPYMKTGLAREAGLGALRGRRAV